MLGAAATEAALAAMSAIIHQKARSGSMSAIFGRGGTKRGTPVTMVASDRSGEVNSVMPRKCARTATRSIWRLFELYCLLLTVDSKAKKGTKVEMATALLAAAASIGAANTATAAAAAAGP